MKLPRYESQDLQRVGFQLTLDLCACKVGSEPKYQDPNQPTSNYQRLLPAGRFAGLRRQQVGGLDSTCRLFQGRSVSIEAGGETTEPLKRCV
jgi:hypothetical protein